MVSVTKRLTQIKQPYGGYLPRKAFTVTTLEDHITLEQESISPQSMGLVVDYLTRVALGTAASYAFRISLKGAKLLGEDEWDYAVELLEDIKIANWDSQDSIESACELVHYDSAFRAGLNAYSATKNNTPDEGTLSSIRTLVQRSLTFFEKYGPVTQDGFTFNDGYTTTINSGDGDFLTQDTLWDFKVSKAEPASKNTLQLAIYYIMGKHSNDPIFDKITYVGIFNPRLNKVYHYDMRTIDPSIIKEIELSVIEYS